MKRSGNMKNLLLQLLTEMAQGETLDRVDLRLQQELGEDVPKADAMREYLLQPDGTGNLDTCQRALVTDQLLECAEVNFRTLCDLIRYRHLKAAGMVSSVEEFLALTHPDETTDLRGEDGE